MLACPFLRTNDVIVHGDAERAGDIRLRQRRIARKVIVHEHTQNEISLENILHCLPAPTRRSNSSAIYHGAGVRYWHLSDVQDGV